MGPGSYTESDTAEVDTQFPDPNSPLFADLLSEYSQEGDGAASSVTAHGRPREQWPVAWEGQGPGKAQALVLDCFSVKQAG